MINYESEVNEIMCAEACVQHQLDSSQYALIASATLREQQHVHTVNMLCIDCFNMVVSDFTQNMAHHRLYALWETP